MSIRPEIALIYILANYGALLSCEPHPRFLTQLLCLTLRPFYLPREFGSVLIRFMCHRVARLQMQQKHPDAPAIVQPQSLQPGQCTTWLLPSSQKWNKKKQYT